jgi:hypothetical protein
LVFLRILAESEVFQGDCACWAGFGALAGGEMEGIAERFIEWDGDADVEAAGDEGQAEGFFVLGGDLDAEAAVDAFAGFEDDEGVVDALLECAAGGFVVCGACGAGFGEDAEFAVVGFAAVAVEAASGFDFGLAVTEAE